MNLQPFRLDIDDLINAFAEGKMTLLADMKTLWFDKKISCIFEAKPTTKSGLFMQSLYAHCLGYMASAKSISHRLGGLYCLYCLHETQPFEPTFRIYLSPWQLKRLKELVADAKKENIELVYRFVNNMIYRNLFLYGASEFNEGSIEEEASELINVEDACAQHPSKRLCADTEFECYNQETIYQKTGLNERQMLENQSQNSNQNIEFNVTSVNGDDSDSEGYNDLLQLLDELT
ncbi:small nuclear RNA activating complex, subunit SNAP43 protein [Tanacetum coccineum]